MAPTPHPSPTLSLNNMVPDMGTEDAAHLATLAESSGGRWFAEFGKTAILQKSSSLWEANRHFPPAAHSGSAAAPPLTSSAGGIDYIRLHSSAVLRPRRSI